MSKRVDLQVRVNASPARVFRALTEPRELEAWFAERADVSLTDGYYDFWGRYTPGTPNRETGRHVLLAHEPDRTLEYGWDLPETSTTVSIELVSERDGTLVRVRHEGLLPRRPGRASMIDFWHVSLQNLLSWVERGTIAGRADFTPAPGDVEVAVEIDAVPEAVFTKLIEPAQLDRWISDRAEVEPEVGGRYSFGWDHGPIKILELEEHERLSYSWEYAGEPDSVVHWTLRGGKGGTSVLLVHSGFAPDDDREDYRVGWRGFLVNLKLIVELDEAWRPPEVLEGAIEAV